MHLFLKLTECKENFEQERKSYEDQLKMLKSEKQQLEAECQQLHHTQKPPEDAVCNSQVVVINIYI